MNLETLFLDEDIEEIYNDTIVYSILKYHSLSKEWQDFFRLRYDHALECLKKRKIESVKIEKNMEDDVRRRLEIYQRLYNIILEQNKSIIGSSAPSIENLVIKTISQKTSEIEKISFLFDFVESYITYSEDYYHYCLKVPPIDNFGFDFKYNLPVDSSISGMFVIGQGICDDISNFMIYLGKRLDLDIDKVFADYQGDNHCFNSIMLSDGNTYLIDVTRAIRGDKNKKECFLVSQKDLNKNGKYIFQNQIQTTTYSRQIPDFSEEASELIDKINRLKPYVFQLSNGEGKIYHR